MIVDHREKEEASIKSRGSSNDRRDTERHSTKNDNTGSFHDTSSHHGRHKDTLHKTFGRAQALSLYHERSPKSKCYHARTELQRTQRRWHGACQDSVHFLHDASKAHYDQPPWCACSPAMSSEKLLNVPNAVGRKCNDLTMSVFDHSSESSSRLMGRRIQPVSLSIKALPREKELGAIEDTSNITSTVEQGKAKPCSSAATSADVTNPTSCLN